MKERMYHYQSWWVILTIEPIHLMLCYCPAREYLMIMHCELYTTYTQSIHHQSELIWSKSPDFPPEVFISADDFPSAQRFFARYFTLQPSGFHYGKKHKYLHTTSKSIMYTCKIGNGKPVNRARIQYSILRLLLLFGTFEPYSSIRSQSEQRFDAKAKSRITFVQGWLALCTAVCRSDALHVNCLLCSPHARIELNWASF